MNKKSIDQLFFSHVREFLDVYLEKQCSRSSHTIKGYRDALTIFRRFITSLEFSLIEFSFEDCSRDLVLNFLEYLQELGYAISTCNQRLAALKAYLWYVADCNITYQQTALIVSRIPFLKEPEKVKEILNKECLIALLSAPTSNRIGIRDTTIMVILYDTAIRLSELLNLRISDVNLIKSTPYLRIYGKGDKERIVSLSDNTVVHLRYYLKLYHNNTNSSEYLFYTVIHEQVNAMSPGNVERLINKYANQIREEHPECPKRVHPHMLRRTRATNLYQSDIELELISRILGHSSTQTTRIYAKPSLEMLKKAMQSDDQVIIEEKQQWPQDEAELAKLFGLR